MTYDDVRAIALELPDVEEGTSYGTAALKTGGKMFIRLKEDGETVVLRTDSIERDHLMRTKPKIFHITDHYRDYPWVLVRLNAVPRSLMKELVESAYKRVKSSGKSRRRGSAQAGVRPKRRDSNA